MAALVSPPRFSLHEVGRRWGQLNALQNVSLTIEPGEFVAVVGPSGGGKSTLLDLLGGSLKASEGKIQVDHTPLANYSRKQLRQHRSRCGRIEQDGLVLPHLSVHNNILAGLLPHWPWWKILGAALWPIEQHRVQNLLQQVGLEDRQWEQASVLSGGQKQRVAVLRALAGNPPVLLADEPTASLDPGNSQEVADLILNYAKERKATVVWCTHWLSLIQSRMDRVLAIHQGKVVIDAPSHSISPEEIQALYQNTEESLQ